MPLSPQVLPGRAFQQVDRKSRLLFHWRAADLSLTALTGQVGVLTRASAAPLMLDAAGRYHGAAHSEPAFEMYDLDGDGIYETPGLLCARQQQQDATQSDNFADGVWTKTGVTVSTDHLPRGPVNGASMDRLVENGASSTHGITRSMTITAGDVCLLLAVLRPNGRTKYRLYVDSDAAANRFRAVLDTVAGTLTPEANIGTGVLRNSGVRRLADGCWLAWIMGSVDAAATTAAIRVLALDSGGNETYTGDSTSGCWLGHVQFARGIGDMERLLVAAGSAVTDPAHLVQFSNAIPTTLRDALTVYVELARPSNFDFTGTFANPRYAFGIGSSGWRLYLRHLEGANRTMRLALWDGATGSPPTMDKAILAGARQRMCVQAVDLRTTPKVNLDVGGGFSTVPVAGTGIPPLTALGNGHILLGQGPSGAADTLGGGVLVLKVADGQFTSDQMRALF